VPKKSHFKKVITLNQFFGKILGSNNLLIISP